MSAQGGKMKKSKGAPQRRHNPLERDITEEKVLGEYEGKTKKKDKDTGSEGEMTAAMGRKIAKVAAEQEQRERVKSGADVSAAGLSAGLSGQIDYDDDEVEEVEEVEMDEKEYEALMGEMQVSAADEAAMAMFMPDAVKSQVKLSDIIMQKIAEKEMMADQDGEDDMPELDPKIVEVYQGVGKVLKRYKSGKLPKAFKMIAGLQNWEEILYLTEPDEWSNNSMFEATRSFTSKHVSVLQRFLNLVLLPRVRDDIRQNAGKLNYHLYRSIKKCLFKPAAFYKGFLLPLTESGTCSLQEAWIICSVMTKVSIRLLDSAAALLKMAEMEYNGSTSLFMRTLLNKKYALPYRVLDSVSAHFLQFASDDREMPVMWHQCLLTFVQRYKEDLTVEEKEAMKELMRKHNHPQITPEIRRELFSSRSRGEAAPAGEMEVE